MEPKGGSMDAREQRLYIGRGLGDDSFQQREALAE
jgi:hypothetical protein